jgi:prevent-host-death family protein
MQVTIHEAKTHLSKLIRKALSGEEIIIARGNQPLVKLVVLPELSQQRRIGGAKGLISIWLMILMLHLKTLWNT